MRTSGLPPAIRVSVRAMSSKTWIRSSAFFSSGAAATRESPLIAARSSPISASCGKRATRSGGEIREVRAFARSRPGRGTGSSPRSARRSPDRRTERSCSTKRPERTRIFRTAARFFSSSSRRVLPIPGSPATTANWPSPAIAAFSRRWSSANSFSRPTKTEAAGRGITRLAERTTDMRNSSLARLARWRRSASATWPAFCGRLAGSFSRQRRMMSSSSSRISAPSARGVCGTS